MKPGPDEDSDIEFLSVESVLALHQRQLERYGGGEGLRDRALLESAVAQPQTSLGGVYSHRSLVEMGAAYLFHIVSNHPFVDGNKRTGLLCSLVFLHLNGIALLDESTAFYELTMGVAQGRLTKAEVAREFERISAIRA